MQRKAFQRHVDEPAVNLTPLIDVVFVILIMFILAAPLLELDRVNLAEASKEAHSQMISVQESSPVTIHVRRDNSVTLNHEAISLEQLQDRLREAKRVYPHARPQLFHDQRGHFGVYQAIKNAAEAAGFEQMDVVLKP